MWRRDESNDALALRITKDGLAAIQADEAPVDESNNPKSQAVDTSGPQRASTRAKAVAQSRIELSRCFNGRKGQLSLP
jgi:hypothetical protein